MCADAGNRNRCGGAIVTTTVVKSGTTRRGVRTCIVAIVASICIFAAASAKADEEATEELTTITVVARRVANELPAGTLSTPVTLLRYDAQFDVQSRGVAETQADVTVRGGVFENTGFKVGAVTLFDPQTGHYAAELPLAPAALTLPRLRVGIDNALAGFNSAVATVDYGLTAITDERTIGLGGGSDALRSAELRLAERFAAYGQPGFGASLTYAGSESDGSRPDGDHDMERMMFRLQHSSAGAQTDIVLSHQDKFFGWPGAYTGFATLPETDHTKTSLFLVNHRNETSTSQWWEAGAYFRSLDDDYDFDRRTSESGAPGSFDHKTESYAIGAQGSRPAGQWRWLYGGQITGDRLVRSTDLLGGNFDSRRYATLTLVPVRTWNFAGGTEGAFRFGATIDWSSEDSSELLPLTGFSLTRRHDDVTTVLSIEYAAASQLPGYTVLKSGASGLFGGNPTLGRERADTFEISATRASAASRASVSLFYRRDDDLVDWTFSSASPFARQANPVDLDVTGLELLWQRDFAAVTLGLGYVVLDKEADYGIATVDASYYALNFARQRLTAALVWRPHDTVEVRLDAEARKQKRNTLRADQDDAFGASLSAVWRPALSDGLRLDLVVDNLSNSNFAEFPGTLSTRRQISLRAAYTW